MNKITTKNIVISALLVALNIVLVRYLAINTPIVKIGFGFLPLIVAALYLGPLYTGVIHAIADVIGVMMVPNAAFNPVFTLTAFLVGVTYGLFLYPASPLCKGLTKSAKALARVFHISEEKSHTFADFFIAFITGFVVTIVFSLLANTFLIHFYFRVSYAVLIPTRLIQSAILIPLHTVMIPLVIAKLMPQLKKQPTF